MLPKINYPFKTAILIFRRKHTKTRAIISNGAIWV